MSNYGPPPSSPQDPYGQPQDPYGQQPYGQQPYGTPPGFGPSGSGNKGFWGSLFDFSFNSFVTPMIVKFVYILVTIVLFLAWLVATIATFTQSAGGGILVLIGGAIVALVYLCLARMTMEFYVAIIRMSEDIHNRLPKG